MGPLLDGQCDRHGPARSLCALAGQRARFRAMAERSVARACILIPAYQAERTLGSVIDDLRAALPALAGSIIVIDDGSTDGSWALLQKLADQYPFLRSVRHRAQRGIAEALRTGYLNARGDILVFYPADLQFKPEDVPRLVAPILADESDMVTGYKQGKYEKAFVSSIYNRLSRTLFHVPVRDLNNVKAYRREIMAALPMRPDFHRYMIVLAAAQGYTVTEVPIPLYPRHAGRSKFGWSRIPIGVLDMLAVWFELRFGQKPLLAFGMLGAGMFLVGLLAGLVALAVLAINGVGIRAVWTVVQTCLVLGAMFFATGILGEQIAQQRAELRELRRELEAGYVRAAAMDDAAESPRDGE